MNWQILPDKQWTFWKQQRQRNREVQTFPGTFKCCYVAFFTGFCSDEMLIDSITKAFQKLHKTVLTFLPSLDDTRMWRIWKQLSARMLQSLLGWSPSHAENLNIIIINNMEQFNKSKSIFWTTSCRKPGLSTAFAELCLLTSFLFMAPSIPFHESFFYFTFCSQLTVLIHFQNHLLSLLQALFYIVSSLASLYQ